MNYVVKIFRCIKEFCSLDASVGQTLKKEAKKIKNLDFLLGTSDASLSGNLLISKGVKAKTPG